MRKSAALVVFSHLRWNFVYQRPQQVLSRIAKRRKVYFIEEPVHDVSSHSHFERSRPEPNLTVLVPHTPVDETGFTPRQNAEVGKLLGSLIASEEIGAYDAWFYTPMATPLLESLNPQVVVYDCMDELSAFLNAPKELIEQENALLAQADLVFTGGPSLYKAKKNRHTDVYCFPSSVDSAHFFRGALDQTEPQEQKALPHPRLGYFGVIDERIDLSLIDSIAASHADWQIVMVGPVVKIDPATLPRRANIHYFGKQDYRVLPSFVKGWDVCLLPFARNEATRFISPTKVLEYMAAGKLIVSTPIQDVAEPYGNLVYLADTPQGFVQACEEALHPDRRDNRERILGAFEVIAGTSWDRTATAMETLLESTAESRINVRHRAAPGTQDADVLVAGAGPTGLSAAYHLGERATLLEQHSEIGGWCRSVQSNGFTFDYAGHIMFSEDPYVHQMYRLLLGDNVHWQNREAWVYSKSTYTRYPFQASLYGLPADVVKECITGAIEARFGSLTPPRTGKEANGKNGKTNGDSKAAADAQCAKDGIADCCADGVLEASAPLVSKFETASPAAAPPQNFEEFIYKVWGAGIAKHFAIPYNRKLWAVPLNEMETSWLGGRVPLPNLEEMIDGALKPSPRPMGPNARFGYPLHGGFAALMEGFRPHLKGPVRLNTAIIGVEPKKHLVRLSDGSTVRYRHLINTMPLPRLIRLIGDEAPEEVKAAARKLRHVSVRCVHLGIGREKLTDKHWIYYPEDTVFHRIFVQGNASPHCNPAGGFGITCEITYSPDKPLPSDGQELIERCIQDCIRVGMIAKEDAILAAEQCDLPYAYVVYDHHRKAAVTTIRAWLETQDILLAGRYSEWEYYNSDHAFKAGLMAAQKLSDVAAGSDGAVETVAKQAQIPVSATTMAAGSRPN